MSSAFVICGAVSSLCTAPRPFFPQIYKQKGQWSMCTSIEQPPKNAHDVERSALAAAAATFTLRRAAFPESGERRPPAAAVANALMQLERQQRRNKAVTDVSQLAGQWQLTVTANPTKRWDFLARPMYFPLLARQTFSPADSGSETGVFDNALFLFGSQLRFRGPYRWVGGKANRLEFTFSSLSVKLGPLGPFVMSGIDKAGSEIGSRTTKDLPFFTFFLARDGIAAARGRGGGVALYKRVQPEEVL